MGFFKKKYSDKKLIEMLVAGSGQENQALDDIYAHCFPKIRAQLLKGGADSEDIRDAFQHAVMALWNFVRRPENQIQASICGWLFVATRNDWHNKLDRQKRFAEAQEEITFVYMEAQDQADARTLRDFLQTLLAKLDTQCRWILERRFLDGYDRAQIAEALNFGNLNSVTNKIDKCLKGALQIGQAWN